ncbi:MOSC domain-containing protein [Kribbella sp. DT2]|uniref:MOSC domain-containing protein n=1 Tax=Kribbella sp. DT2 TaxID=3393427 RepID=UPI003CFA7153
MAQVIAVNVVHALIPGAKGTNLTAIDKRPQPGRIAVTELGLVGDSHQYRRHGGPDQALYLYAREDADWWAAQLDREIPSGYFGENLDSIGLDVSNALIGERWRIGTGADAVEVEVRSPRTPCRNFAFRMAVPGWTRRFAHARRPGAYLKVLRTGRIGAGDPVSVLFQPDHDVSVGDCAFDPSPERMARMLDSGIDLMPAIRELAERVSGRSTAS